MKTKQNRHFLPSRVLNCLKPNIFLLLNPIFIAFVGVFLLTNLASASPITAERLINLTNQTRKNAKITDLTKNETLTRAANTKGEAILKNQTFSHNIKEKKFSTWVREAGYNYSYTGENLAIDFISSEGLMKAWINSEPHKNNLLNPNYKEIGIAVLSGNFENQNTIIVVQLFGTKQKTIIPEEIMAKNEQLIPYRGEVLSASSIINKTIKTKNYLPIIITVSILTAIFSTYLYVISIFYLINLIKNRR